MRVQSTAPGKREDRPAAQTNLATRSSDRLRTTFSDDRAQATALSQLTEAANKSFRKRTFNAWQAIADRSLPVSAHARENKIRRLDAIRTPVERIPGGSIDDVRMRQNSSRPGQLHAHAHGGASEIDVASASEKPVQPIPVQRPLVVQRALYTYADVEKSRDIAGRAQLPSTKAAIVDLQNGETSATGLGEETSGMQTIIQWGPLNGKDGTSVNAVLGPDHTKGTEPGSSGLWVEKRKELSLKAGGHRYIAGHLLNHELGGPGDAAQNLAAIPEETNKRHSSGIEERVKKDVNTDGAWGRYYVSVDHRADADGTQYASKLNAYWQPIGVQNGALVHAKGEKISLNIPIPAPSHFKAKTASIANVAPVSEQILLGPNQLVTPFRYDQIPLASFTSKVSHFGHGNVELITALERSRLARDDEIVALKEDFKRSSQLLATEISSLYEDLFDQYQINESLQQDLVIQEFGYEELLEGRGREIALLSDEFRQSEHRIVELQASLAAQQGTIREMQTRLDIAEAGRQVAESERDKAREQRDVARFERDDFARLLDQQAAENRQLQQQNEQLQQRADHQANLLHQQAIQIQQLLQQLSAGQQVQPSSEAPAPQFPPLQQGHHS